MDDVRRATEAKLIVSKDQMPVCSSPVVIFSGPTAGFRVMKFFYYVDQIFDSGIHQKPYCSIFCRCLRRLRRRPYGEACTWHMDRLPFPEKSAPRSSIPGIDC